MHGSLSVKSLALRLFSGIAGGLLGMVCALCVLFLSSLQQPNDPDIAVSYSMVTILSITFVATVTSNIFATLFLSFLESGKYVRRKKMLSHVFVFTFALFVFLIPFYLFASDSVISTAGIHFLISALMAALICEILSGWRYALTGLMGVVFSGAFLVGVFALLFAVSENDSMLFILALPLAWMCIPLGIFLVEVCDHAWVRLYGSSLLSPEDEVK